MKSPSLLASMLACLLLSSVFRGDLSGRDDCISMPIKESEKSTIALCVAAQ